MDRNYEISKGIYLIQDKYELDLHNNYSFTSLEYRVIERKLVLKWVKSIGDWISVDSPAGLNLEFCGVSEFRFMPRDESTPFTEDDCINSIGYWTNEEWASGVFLLEKNQEVEPGWLMAIDFMSGAALVVQAERSDANIIT